MMPSLAIRRSMSASSKRATFFGSKPAKARRNASRFRSTMLHDRPAWKPSSINISHNMRASCWGTPHSSS
jgi:hypothetical protein